MEQRTPSQETIGSGLFACCAARIEIAREPELGLLCRAVLAPSSGVRCNWVRPNAVGSNQGGLISG